MRQLTLIYIHLLVLQLFISQVIQGQSDESCVSGFLSEAEIYTIGRICNRQTDEDSSDSSAASNNCFKERTSGSNGGYSTRIIPDLRVTCNGTLTGWRAAGETTNGDTTPLLQIWREMEGQQERYQRIARNIPLGSCDGRNEPQEISANSRYYECTLETPVSVRTGDIVGLVLPRERDTSFRPYFTDDSIANYVYNFHPLTVFPDPSQRGSRRQREDDGVPLITLIIELDDPTTARPTSVESTTGEPTTIKPTTDETTTAESITAYPTTDESITAEPTIVYPITDESTTGEPRTVYPTTDESTTGEPTTEEETNWETTAQPTNGESTAAESTTGLSTIREPNTEEASTGVSTIGDPMTGEATNWETTVEPHTGESIREQTNEQSTTLEAINWETTMEQTTIGEPATGQPITVQSTTLTTGYRVQNIENSTTIETTTTEPDPITAESTISELITAESTTGESTTAESTTGELTTPESTTGEPTTAELTTGEPSIIGEPTTAESTTGEQSTTREPTTAESTGEPTAAESTTGEPTTEESTTGEPTTAEFTVRGPTTPESTSGEPTTEESTTGEPITAKSTSGEPTTTEPTAGEQTTGATTTESTTTAGKPTSTNRVATSMELTNTDQQLIIRESEPTATIMPITKTTAEEPTTVTLEPTVARTTTMEIIMEERTTYIRKTFTANPITTIRTTSLLTIGESTALESTTSMSTTAKTNIYEQTDVQPTTMKPNIWIPSSAQVTTGTPKQVTMETTPITRELSSSIISPLAVTHSQANSTYIIVSESSQFVSTPAQARHTSSSPAITALKLTSSIKVSTAEPVTAIAASNYPTIRTLTTTMQSSSIKLTLSSLNPTTVEVQSTESNHTAKPTTIKPQPTTLTSFRVDHTGSVPATEISPSVMQLHWTTSTTVWLSVQDESTFTVAEEGTSATVSDNSTLVTVSLDALPPNNETLDITYNTGVFFGDTGNTTAISVGGLVIIITVIVLVILFFALKRYRKKRAFSVHRHPAYTNPIIESINVTVNLGVEDSSSTASQPKYTTPPTTTNTHHDLNQPPCYKQEDRTYMHLYSEPSLPAEDTEEYTTIINAFALEDSGYYEVPVESNNSQKSINST